jgi:DNA (cytosine-5)-methyltransferase 1
MNGDIFRSLREKAGLKAKEASEKLGVSLKTIYRWENGEARPHPLAMKEIKELAGIANRVTNLHQDHSFRFIDLFAGIGGFRKAFDSIGGKCVFTSEWDKAARATYTANYVCDHGVEGDIREFTKDVDSLEKIPAHDLLVAGFPCQPFSLAGVVKKNSLGKQHGFKDVTQGTLFFDLAQILEYHRPPAILLENVKNLVSHDGKNTFKIIKHTLEEELGYTIFHKVIDARSWVPQHRERIFIVGFRNPVDFRFEDVIIPPKNEAPTLASILHGPHEEDESPYFINGKVADKYTLTPRLWEYLQEYKEKHQAKGNGFGFSVFGKNDVARTLSARYYKDGSEILISQRGKRPRRLTPRECSRLMGFDAPGESNFQIPNSDTPSYKQFGNSVVVPVAKAIAQAMHPYILQAMGSQLDIPFEEIKQRKSA